MSTTKHPFISFVSAGAVRPDQEGTDTKNNNIPSLLNNTENVKTKFEDDEVEKDAKTAKNTKGKRRHLNETESERSIKPNAQNGEGKRKKSQDVRVLRMRLSRGDESVHEALRTLAEKEGCEPNEVSIISASGSLEKCELYPNVPEEGNQVVASKTKLKATTSSPILVMSMTGSLAVGIRVVVATTTTGEEQVVRGGILGEKKHRIERLEMVVCF